MSSIQEAAEFERISDFWGFGPHVAIAKAQPAMAQAQLPRRRRGSTPIESRAKYQPTLILLPLDFTLEIVWASRAMAMCFCPLRSVAGHFVSPLGAAVT